MVKPPPNVVIGPTYQVARSAARAVAALESLPKLPPVATYTALPSLRGTHGARVVMVDPLHVDVLFPHQQARFKAWREAELWPRDAVVETVHLSELMSREGLS